MKQLTEETQKSLEAIRDKVSNKSKYPATSYSTQEVLHLQEVNREILIWSGIRQNTIDMSCPSCIQEAINIAYNYVTYHEIRPDNRKAKVIGVVSMGAARNTGEAVAQKHGYDVSDLHLYADYTKEDLEAMKYSDLMELAKHYGHTGKREKAEKLIAFIERKMKG